nr:hypothetical protein [uncultured Parabacteroides sp.]
MFTILIKGQRDPRDTEMVKLNIVFYRTGFARVPKVLNITSLYSDWDSKTRQFKPNSADNITKNKLLRKERIKYFRIAEKWEYSGKAWTPVELSHYYENHLAAMPRLRRCSICLSRKVRTIAGYEMVTYSQAKPQPGISREPDERLRILQCRNTGANSPGIGFRILMQTFYSTIPSIWNDGTLPQLKRLE